MLQILLQKAIAILLQNATKVYYNMRYGFYCIMLQFYCKLRHLLQNSSILLENATVITKCVGTPCQTSMTELLCKKNQRLYVVDYFCEKPPLFIFGRPLNTSLMTSFQNF